MRYLPCFAACLLFAGCTENKPAPSSTTVTANKPVERDNTGVNVRDRNTERKTPIDQNENKDDVKITSEIRKAVTERDLSTDAHNVKIITQEGKVTLRGPVKSVSEKEQIEEIATGVAGAGNVTSELEVAK